MDDRLRTRVAAAMLALGLAVLDLIMLLTVVHAVGTDGALYYREQMKADILPASGLSDEDLRALDGMLAEYLGGDDRALLEPVGRLRFETTGGSIEVQAPLMSMEVFGALQPVFSERELTHLQDCFNLFRLLRKVRRRLVPWAILLILGGARLLADRRRVRWCAGLSLLAVLLLLGALTAYAAADFDRAFTLFHRILFRNDLWQLNPATSLLIRICPESMFMAMGIRIAVYSLIAMIAAAAAAMALTCLWPGGKEDNTWKTTTRRESAPKRYDFGNRGTR